MLERKYWISELAALSGVSNRTIRYYIHEGLLPQPRLRGRYAEFTDEYIHRLQLIKVLKESYLPLNRIKEVLDALDDNQIVPLLEEFEKDPISALSGLQALPVFEQAAPDALQLNSPTIDSALSYIHSLRENPTLLNTPSQARVHRFRQEAPMQTLEAVEWQRIRLAPGLELHVRQPVRPRVQRLIEQVIALVNQNHPFQREE